MPTGTYTAPPNKDVNDAYGENNWDTHVKGNIEFIKSYLDELKNGVASARITADVTTTTHTEAAPLTAITLPSFTVVTGYTAFTVELHSPGISLAGGGGISVWDGASDLGRLQGLGSAGLGTQQTRITLATGAHVLTIRLFTAGGSPSTISAGAGGVGTKLPAYAIVRHAPPES
jgi:hypothetical protein